MVLLGYCQHSVYEVMNYWNVCVAFKVFHVVVIKVSVELFGSAESAEEFVIVAEFL